MKAERVFKLFGKWFEFLIDGKKKRGELVQIRIDADETWLVGINEDGFIEEYEVSKIEEIKNNKNNESLVKDIVKRVNKKINSFKFDLKGYREKEIKYIIEKIDNIEIKKELLEGITKRNLFQDCEKIYDNISKLNIALEERELLSGMIAYTQHDQKKAYEIFSKRWLINKEELDNCRDFILIADEFDNDVLCFFLLKHFFRIVKGNINNKNSGLWWKCIYYMVKYNDFTLLENITVSRENIIILMYSFIYIFDTYNMEHLSVGLTELFRGNKILQEDIADLGDNVEEAIDKVDLLKHYLPDTAQGYYLRFESCMEQILKKYEEGTIVYDDNDKEGYIYEFVKTRNYGFIIGNDFQKYFYHGDYLSRNLRKRIVDNIYSGKEIEFEDKIYVQFHCDYCNKRIQAVDII